MDDDKQRKQREDYEAFLAADAEETRKSEESERRNAKMIAAEIVRIVRLREARLQELTEAEMARLQPALDKLEEQAEELAEKLHDALGDDLGASGDELEYGFIVTGGVDDGDYEAAMLAVGFAGRYFSLNGGDGVIVWRRGKKDRLEFAEMGDDGEGIEPWRIAPEGVGLDG